MNSRIDPKELEIRRRLKDDFSYYAKTCLKLLPKDGAIVPFKVNKAQTYIHNRLQQQLEETGKVRAIILKGRQQGCSTYVEGRFIWRVTHSHGTNAYILTHEEDASNNIFNMAKRYYDHLPEYVKPVVSRDNAKELKFPNLDSGYRVGTAGNKSTGRSQTNRLLHGSEVAFWKNAEEHAKGIMQTVPDSDGTEIILESTGNGLGNYFHQQWKMAEAGLSEYIPIFVPWYWQDEYRKTPPDDFTPSDEEVEMMRLVGLDIQQIYWRRQKIVSLSAGGLDGEKAFKQEYPNTPTEAFQVSGGDGLIKSDVVMRARKNRVNGSGPLIVGVDPSRGGDRFATIKRHGRKMYDLHNYVGDQVNTLGKAVAICKTLLDTVDEEAGKVPDMMFIDSGGGAEIVDRLHELGYEKRVKAISFGASPLNTERYKNKRGEIWGEMNAWLTDENLDVQIPDDDQMHADLCASPYSRDSMDRVVLWPKEKIIQEYGFSPDDGDAAALTFAEPVRTGVRKKINFSGWNNV